MSIEAMKQALEALGAISTEFVCQSAHHAKKEQHSYFEPCPHVAKHDKAITSLRQAIAETEKQEPVAMKFKIYKPTVPDPVRQGINNALLPWVYDQDRSSGFDASMWVTPVATLPPQRQPLTDKQIKDLTMNGSDLMQEYAIKIARAIEAAHGIKGEA